MNEWREPPIRQLYVCTRCDFITNNTEKFDNHWVEEHTDARDDAAVSKIFQDAFEVMCLERLYRK